MRKRVSRKAMAARFARSYGEERAERKEFGAQQATALPCISHPVFKGKPVNVDSREVFVRQRFEARGCSRLLPCAGAGVV